MKQKQISIITALFISVFAVGVATSVAQAESGSGSSGAKQFSQSDREGKDSKRDGKEDSKPRQGKDNSGNNSTSGKPNEPKPRHDTSDDSNETTLENSSDDSNAEESNAPEKKPFVGKKLERIAGKKLEKCEEQQEKVNKLMTLVVERSTKNYDRVGELYVMAKKYIDEKGVEVKDFDAKVADIDAKAVAAKAALDELTQLSDFNCESEGPKAEIQVFLESRKGKIEAMVAYRKAVRALMVEAKAEKGNADV